MASPGLAGFAQGLANSPLGNLPGLVQARNQIQMEKEKFTAWKQDRENARVQAENRKTGLMEADEIVKSGGTLPDAVDHLVSLGLTDDAQTLSNIGSNRNLNQYRQDSLAHTIDSSNKAHDLAVDRFEQGKDEFSQTHALSQQASDREDIRLMNTIEIAQEENARARTLFESGQSEEARQVAGRAWENMGWTPQDYGTPEFQGYVDELFRGQSQMVAKEYGISKDRIPIGAEFVETPNGIEVVPKIWNKKTNSVGPMTEKGTSDGTDRVYSLPIERFDQMMKEMGAAPEQKFEKGTFSQYTDPDTGTTRVLNTATGQTSSTASAKTQYVNKVQDDMKSFTAAQEFLPQERVELNLLTSAIAPQLQEAGVPKEGLAGKIGTLVQDEEIRSLVFSDSRVDHQKGQMMILESLIPRGNTEAGATSNQPDPRAAMPREGENPSRNVSLMDSFKSWLSD